MTFLEIQTHATHKPQLKSKYCEHHIQFKSTGSGIIPQCNNNIDTTPTQNLLSKPPFPSLILLLISQYLEDILHVLPYYQELDAIWKGIPSFDSKLVSSKPKVDHVEHLLKIVALKASGVNTAPEEDTDI